MEFGLLFFSTLGGWCLLEYASVVGVFGTGVRGF